MAEQDSKFLQNLKAWFSDLKGVYDFLVPPKTQAVLTSGINTFVSAFIAAVGVAYSQGKINSNIFTDGSWKAILQSLLLAAAATTVREIFKRAKGDYNYPELEVQHQKWVEARDAAKSVG